ESQLADQLLAQRRAYAELEEELTWTRREVKAVRDAVETVARARQDGAGGEVVAELKVLKSLLGKMAESRRQAPAAPKAASKPRAVAAPERAAGKAKAAPAPLPVGHAGPRAVPLGDGASDVLTQVREAIRDDRVILTLQPIVVLPQRKHRAYECFSRLIAGNGSMLMPEQYIALSEQSGLITAIDNMLLFRCIQLVRKVRMGDHNALFFCNISARTLGDDDFFGDFVEFLEANEELAPSLVFEFTQADAAQHGKEQARFLDRLASLGCRFSIDQVQSLELDAERLSRRNVRFVKVKADLLRGQDPDRGYHAFVDLKAKLTAHRITIIAEKVEDEETLLDLLDYGVELGQGYLFGEPKPARASAA
ncbi:MAG: EAL domain-containing protein, partial [Kiloniellales bacterium]|nr:EAL domain-containing protein [Kiloniellales bacterium]